jgi:hypothetical protein
VYIYYRTKKQIMKLGVIILVAALVISIIYFTIIKPKNQDGLQKAVEPEVFPEPVVDEAPAAPVEVPVEEVQEVVEHPIVSDEELEKATEELAKEVVEPKPAKKTKAKASTEASKKVIVKKPK